MKKLRTPRQTNVLVNILLILGCITVFFPL